jgi:hypothetical protein
VYLLARIFVVVLVTVVAVEFAVVSDGTPGVEGDESMVGVCAGARVDVPRALGHEVTSPLDCGDVAAIVAPKPRRPAIVRSRPDAPAARSHLLAAADASRPSDDH